MYTLGTPTRHGLATLIFMETQYGDLKSVCNLLVTISWINFVLCVIGLGDFVSSWRLNMRLAIADKREYTEKQHSDVRSHSEESLLRYGASLTIMTSNQFAT